MPTIYKGSRHTKCPYYIRESEYTITCEGVHPGTETVQKFPLKQRKEDFQEKCCYRYPNECKICQELEKKNYILKDIKEKDIFSKVTKVTP